MTAITLPGTGLPVAVDLVAAENHQLMKLEFGAAGSVTQVSPANPLPSIVPDVTSSGSLAAAAQTVSLALNCVSAASVQLSGTWVGTVTFEGTLDSVTWFQVNGVSASTSGPQPTTTANGLYRLTPGALSAIRANMTAFTSGSATVAMRGSAAVGGTFANQLLPTKNTDGTNSQAIKAASTAAAATDASAVVALHPSSPLPAGTNVIGSVGIAAAQTLAVVTTVSALTAITNALPTGANVIGALTANQSVNKAQINGVAPLMGNGVTGTGSQRVTIASDNTTIPVTATPIAVTKGTQGATGFTTQDLKDAGRNLVCYYTLIPVLTSATDTLQSLTGTKGGVTVAATTTPAVVTTAKNLRVSSITATYISTATSGYAVVRVRAQPAGVATITSTIVATFAVGNSSPTSANSTDCVMEDFPDGSEFAAGVGIGISVQGFVAVTATAVGYVMVSINGYEY